MRIARDYSCRVFARPARFFHAFSAGSGDDDDDVDALLRAAKEGAETGDDARTHKSYFCDRVLGRWRWRWCWRWWWTWRWRWR